MSAGGKFERLVPQQVPGFTFCERKSVDLKKGVMRVHSLQMV